jgi:hypothetical protein
MSKIPPNEDLIAGETFDYYDELNDFIQQVENDLDPPISYPAYLMRQNTKQKRRFDTKTDNFSGSAYISFLKYILKQKRSYKYISPNGSDITGTGTRNNPYHTLHKAYQVLGTTGADANIKYIIAKSLNGKARLIEKLS